MGAISLEEMNAVRLMKRTDTKFVFHTNKLEEILKLCKSKPISFAGKFTLKQTACLNKKALAFIGVDTSIMHISAANDIPVLAFFGPSGTDHWGPWDNSQMISGYNQRNGFQIMGLLPHRVKSSTD